MPQPHCRLLRGPGDVILVCLTKEGRMERRKGDRTLRSLAWREGHLRRKPIKDYVWDTP